MPKIEQKQIVVKELEQKFKEAKLIIFTDYRGLNVSEISELRNRLRIPGVKYQVVKNTMTEFALRNNGQAEVIEHIAGPNAVVFSSDDLVNPAKIIHNFIKDYKKLEVKIGLLEGKLLQPDQIKALAELPPREVLIAQVLGTMNAPITGLVYVLNANITALARALSQIAEQKQAG